MSFSKGDAVLSSTMCRFSTVGSRDALAHHLLLICASGERVGAIGMTLRIASLVGRGVGIAAIALVTLAPGRAGGAVIAVPRPTGISQT
jgi:hypothetical protein